MTCTVPSWLAETTTSDNKVVSSKKSSEPTSSDAGTASNSLTYFSPGDILPANVGGIESRDASLPDWTFPMPVGRDTGHHAYIGTQLSKYHGKEWSNDPVLYSYPHRDNQCEPREKGYANTLCPAGQGHQGVDIRPDDNSKNTWDVVAVEGGVVTLVTGFTTVSIRNGTRTVQYLHMDKKSIADYGVKEGVIVEKGQKIGRVSCIMAGSCMTSIHLHLHAYAGTLGSGQMYHVYPSLIAAYRRSWGLDDGIRHGKLERDGKIEVASP